MSLTKVTYSMINGDVANVLDFGADSTGATDSSTAFQSAVATGKSIFVPKGTYKCGFSLGYGQKIFGEGARDATTLTPTGNSATVILVPATTLSARQHCVIENIGILNPNAYTGCFGIWFQGTDVTTINDSHSIQNVFIKDLENGIYVTGRMILHTYTNVEVTTCTTGMKINGDPANYAVNLNTFIMCRWDTCVNEGVKITGYNVSNAFISCNVEGNNTSATVGIAGMYVENAESLDLLNSYFEMNGNAVPVDAVDPLNNSIGLYLAGERCFNLRVENGWMVQSGTIIAVNVSLGIFGGEISGIRFAPNGTGFDVYIGDKLNGINAPPMNISSNNYFSGQLLIKTDGSGTTSGAVQQTATCQYLTSATSFDLRAANKITCNDATGFNLTTITNRIPGMELKIYNYGTGTITIDATLMASGVASSITTGVAKSYMVLGFPEIGKFVEF